MHERGRKLLKKPMTITRSDEQASPTRRHIADVICENMRDVPPEIMAQMPEDGASEHDHYIYGWPKKQE
jgi:hypothetical protein